MPIPEESSPGKLYYGTLVPLGSRLIDELLAKLERGERPSAVQDESKATYEPLRPKKKEESAG